MIDVAGLVLHFRTPERTVACLKALRREGVNKAVVVDNSEDGGRSIRVVEASMSPACVDGFMLDVLRPERNLGFATGVSLGVSHLRQAGEWHVLLINSDAELEGGAVAKMSAALERAGVVIPLTRIEGAQSPVISLVYYQKLFGLYLRSALPGTILYPSGCCLLIRNDVLRSELFDTAFFFYGEDVLLGWTLRHRRIEVEQCSGATVVHAGAASSRNGSLFYEYHMVRAHWLLAHKLARNSGECIVFILGRCVTLPLRAVLRSLRFGSLTPMRGLAMATVDVVHSRFRSLTPPAC